MIWRPASRWPGLGMPAMLAVAVAVDVGAGSESLVGRRLGSVGLDVVSRSLVATGLVNKVNGPIEYLACGPSGKLHESILELSVSPVDLQAGLLLLGLEPGGGVTRQGQGKPFGPIVDIWLEWEEELPRRLRAEHGILDRTTTNVLSACGWIFTGSAIEGGKFMAQHTQSLVASYWDPWAILNLSLDAGADDTRLTAYENDLPLVGTPVRVRFVPRGGSRGGGDVQ